MSKILCLGADGFLGWSLVQYLGVAGHEVVGVDNMYRREWVNEMGSHSVIPIETMSMRTKALKEVHGVDFEFHLENINEYGVLRDIIRKTKPDCIVNFAHQPSAPYSMAGVENAVFTQTNNITNNLNVLWAIKEVNPKIHLLSLGTMGTYGVNNLDIPEGFFDVEYKGRKDTLPFPHQPWSFYHNAKSFEFTNMNFASKLWKLPITDINQGVVYGTQTDTMIDSRLRTRFDADSCFLGDTCVMHNFGFKPISEISDSDSVITHTGEIKKVSVSMKRKFNGEMFQVSSNFMKSFGVTGNHPLLVSYKKRKIVDNGKKTVYNFSEPEWKTVKEIVDEGIIKKSRWADNRKVLHDYDTVMKLRSGGMTYREIHDETGIPKGSISSWAEKGQMPRKVKDEQKRQKKSPDGWNLLIPIPKSVIKDKVINLSDFYGIVKDGLVYTPNPANENKTWGKGISNNIIADKRFCSIVGMYIGDGYSSNSCIGFTFVTDKKKKLVKELMSDFKNVFGVDSRTTNRKNMIVVNSIIIKKMFSSLFGKGAKTKKLPDWFFNLDDECIKAFIRSYWACDGYIGKKQASISSSSEVIINQVRLLLLRLRILAGNHNRVRENTLAFKGRKPYKLKSNEYSLSIAGESFNDFLKIIGQNPKKKTYNQYKISGDYFAVPIRDIKQFSHNGYVYNMEVEDNHSYCVPAVAHNCFGTAINRFCSQAIIDYPLTVYGDVGKMTRGFIALRDSMQCLKLAIENPAGEGEYRVFNQLDECYDILQLAEIVKKVGKKVGLDVKINHIENPRAEKEEHYYNPESNKLRNLGFKPTMTLQQELKIMFKDLIPHKDRIEEKRDAILPKIKWK